MRNTLITLGAVAALGAALAACGGAGGGTTASAPAALAPAAVTTPIGNLTVSNATGPTAQVTVSIRVPARTTPTSALITHLRSVYGSKLAAPNLRMMSNTSPSAVIRAAGVRQDAYALRIQQTTKRDPSFIPGATETMELVIASGSTVVYDATAECNQSSCTNTFGLVPVGTGYTAVLYLYDSCTFLIAAGKLSNVNVVTGTNSPITITLNGLVAYFDITTNASLPLVDDPSQAQNFNITVQAYDWDDDSITTPGVLLDANFDQITGITVAQDATDVTPYPTVTATPLASLGFSPLPYHFAGTGSDTTVNFTATEIAGANVVPAFNQNGAPAPTQTGSLALAAQPVTLQWTNPENYPIAGQAKTPTFTLTSSAQPTTATLEFPTLSEAGTTTMGLVENNLSGYTGNITFTNNGSCSGIVSYAAGPTAYQTLVSSNVALTTYNLASPNAACAVTATDGSGRAATLNLYFDQESLTIQQSARARK